MVGGGPACPQAGSLLWTWEGTAGREQEPCFAVPAGALNSPPDSPRRCNSKQHCGEHLARNHGTDRHSGCETTPSAGPIAASQTDLQMKL